MASSGIRWRHHLRALGWSLITGPLVTPFFLLSAITMSAFVAAATKINFLLCTVIAASLVVFLEPRRRLLEVRNRNSLPDEVVNPGETAIESLAPASYLKRVLIIRRSDGNHTWHHEAYLNPDPEDSSDEAWHEVQPTGTDIFESYERALSDAKLHLPWLQEIPQPQVSIFLSEGSAGINDTIH